MSKKDIIFNINGQDITMLPLKDVIEGREQSHPFVYAPWIDAATYKKLKSEQDNKTEKYRPFKTQKECWKEMHKHPDFGWVKFGETICNIQNITDNIAILNYEELYSFDFSDSFRNLKFTDNAPFGIKDENTDKNI